jgi:hypothetical protein
MPRRKRRPPHPARPLWGELYPTLDLHGETADAAVRRTEQWLRARASEGARTVRVITGWGRHSAGPPVLRGEVETLLVRLRGTLVADATLEVGGGAFRIELRRPSLPRRDTARPTTTRPPRGDPDAELRRRAEEALAELGITPTPALLAIEMRRLQREARRGGDD